MQIDLQKLYKVAWCDPSGARPANKGNARAAIVCVGMDDLERIYILQSWAAFCGADEILNRIYKFEDKWQPAVFGIDTTATQTIWLDMIRKDAELKGRKAPKMRGVALRGEKRRVIETIIQPRAARGQLFRPPEPEVKELMSEWKNFPSGMYRDALDALAHAIDLLPLRPPDVRKEMEVAHYRAYLKRIGLSQAEQDRRIAEISSNG